VGFWGVLPLPDTRHLTPDTDVDIRFAASI
jgi:hypothetical protein